MSGDLAALKVFVCKSNLSGGQVRAQRMDEFVKRASKLEELLSVEVSFPRGFKLVHDLQRKSLSHSLPQVTLDFSRGGGGLFQAAFETLYLYPEP